MLDRTRLFVLLVLATQCLAREYPAIKTDLSRNTPTESDRVHLAGVNAVSYAGYIEVNQQYGANLYYYFVESQSKPETDPFVLWLQGGPGCSSLFGSFVENGPVLIDQNGNLHPNPYSWNTRANIIYIDNPVGTGFSYVNNWDGYVTSESQMAVELYTALAGFLLKHPKYRSNPFYIFGESYAGKYIPSLAHYILSLGSQSALKLKAIGMGDGWVDPYIQTGSYAEFLYQQNLISWEERDVARGAYKAYQLLIDAEQYVLADDAGNLLMQSLITAAGGVDPYDIRYTGGDPTDPLQTALQVWLSTPAGQKQMNANSTYTVCATAPYFGLLDDIEQSVANLLPDLLQNYRVLNYNGNKDLICNYVGTDSWTSVINWPGQNAYNNAVVKTWTVDGQVAGNWKVGGNLTHIIVNNAGHMVPFSQPKNSLNMFLRYLDNTFV